MTPLEYVINDLRFDLDNRPGCRPGNFDFNPAVDFLLNSWEHSESEAESIDTLTEWLQGNREAAEKIVKAWEALPGEQRCKLEMPIEGDVAIRCWVVELLELNK